MNYGKKKYKSISKRADAFLKGDENQNVDFKRLVKKISSEDFVAFANSENGGTLLIGVDEIKDSKGRQKGKVVGCPISDENKLTINNKAYSCIPSVDISIHIENTSSNPFYRVEILPGKHKPYSTSSGVYKIRKDGNNKALEPVELLNIFLQEESDSFLSKFKKATIELRDDLSEQNQELMEKLWNMTFQTENKLADVADEINIILDNVLTQSGSIQSDIKDFYQEMYESSENMRENLDINYSVKDKLKRVDDNIINVAWKLNALLEHHDIEDPEITNARNKIKAYLKVNRKIFKRDGVEVDDGFFQNIYDNSGSIIKNNYSLQDIINWYNDIE